MKKWVCILLALVLCMGLAGCQENKTETEGSSADRSIVEESGPMSEQAEEPEENPEPTPAPEQNPEPVCLTVEEAEKLPAGTVIKGNELPKEGVSDFFYAEKVSDAVFSRMEGVSYREGCPVSREELRYVRVLHCGFDGETHIGELVCNKDIAEEMADIFEKLYYEEYLIEKMLLVDEYGGEDEASMEDNNTSCFNYRPVSGTSTLSRHAYGLAIDINPLYNPYVTSHGYEPANAGDYIDRSKDTPYKITSTDPCYLAFAEKDFAWGGWWHNVQDYQHFEK